MESTTPESIETGHRKFMCDVCLTVVGWSSEVNKLGSIFLLLRVVTPGDLSELNW